MGGKAIPYNHTSFIHVAMTTNTERSSILHAGAGRTFTRGRMRAQSQDERLSRFFFGYLRPPLFLIVTLFMVMAAVPCGAATPGGVSKGHFSIKANEEPLIGVLERISAATGYAISVDKEWENTLVTAEIKDISIHAGLKKILAALGDPNNAIVTYEEEKKIRIFIYDPVPVDFKTVHGLREQTASYQRGHLAETADQVVAESDSMAPGQTDQGIDPLDLEIIPPERPGEKGLTEWELLDQRTMKRVDFLKLEIIPPERSGERGLTEREFMAMRDRPRRIAPLDSEIVPPERSGERGLTEREFLATQDHRSGRIDPLDQEILPPERP